MGGVRWSLFCGRENGWRFHSDPTHGVFAKGRQPMNTQEMNLASPLDDGGPVYPTLPEHGFNSGMPGLTKREYFAGLAMQGLLSNGAAMQETSTDLAEISCCMADALLVALKGAVSTESLPA